MGKHVRFDHARASMRHVKQEQFQKHKALRQQQLSDEYMSSDSGNDVLLAVFECRNMTPVMARIPFCIEDLDEIVFDGEQVSDGQWFRETRDCSTANDVVVARPRLEFRRL